MFPLETINENEIIERWKLVPLENDLAAKASDKTSENCWNFQVIYICRMLMRTNIEVKMEWTSFNEPKIQTQFRIHYGFGSYKTFYVGYSNFILSSFSLDISFRPYFSWIQLSMIVLFHRWCFFSICFPSPELVANNCGSETRYFRISFFVLLLSFFISLQLAAMGAHIHFVRLSVYKCDTQTYVPHHSPSYFSHCSVCLKFEMLKLEKRNAQITWNIYINTRVYVSLDGKVRYVSWRQREIL